MSVALFVSADKVMCLICCCIHRNIVAVMANRTLNFFAFFNFVRISFSSAMNIVPFSPVKFRINVFYCKL